METKFKKIIKIVLDVLSSILFVYSIIIYIAGDFLNAIYLVLVVIYFDLISNFKYNGNKYN